MKNKIFCKHKNFVFAILIGMIVGSCSSPYDLGLELLSSSTSDLVNVKSIVDYDINSYTVSEDSIRTDETINSLLGSLNDPVFGKTTIDLACQFRLSYYPDFADDAVADSIFLYMYYKYVYGDTLTNQRLKIYELDNSLDIDEKYYQDVDLLSYSKNNLLADFEFVPKRTVKLDSTYGTLDTLYQLIKIPIDISLAEKLISAEDSEIANNDVFLDYFKGLYIQTEEVDDNGAILAMNLVANESVSGSALLMHYHQSNTETGVVDTLTNAYLPSKFSARVNGYKHDYSGTPIENFINNEQLINNKLYLQSTGGLRAKLYLPNLDFWVDSVNATINKAELIFQIDTIASEPDFYVPPKQLLLTIIGEEGGEYIPKDYSFSPTYYGGTLDTTDHTYRFNIAQHLQEIANGNFINNGFYLSTINKNYEFRRVILNGGGEAKGIELRIAYSTITQ